MRQLPTACLHRAGSAAITCLLLLLAATPAYAQAPELRRIPATDAATVLGRRVLDHGGDEIARLVDVLVDSSGRPVAAVLDFGGYMGLGSRKVAVDWARLRFSIAGDGARVTVDLDADTIAAAPEYNDGSEGASVLTGPVPRP
jgi:hypothetical protein